MLDDAAHASPVASPQAIAAEAHIGSRADIAASASDASSSAAELVPVAPAPPVQAPLQRAHTPEAHRATAPRLIPDLPPVVLSLPPDSGLVLVETSHRDITAPETPQAPVGPRRARKPRVPMPEEPLQIVETRKEQPPAN